jgi:hypothetical protein
VGRGVFSFISLFVAMATSQTARARAVGHALAGVNATQVKLVGSDTTSTSHGYASYTVGVGFSILYKSKASLSLDALYTNRKFGFGITSADFSTIQLPIMARFHTPILYVGAGVYSALWSFKGEMLTDGKSERVKVSDAGQSATEFGFLLSTGMKRSILGLPLLFEVRRFQSINDLAKSNTLKGSLIEWQILVGYQFNDEPPAATSAIPAASSAVPAEKTRPIAPPPLILRKRKLSIDAIDTSDTGVVIQPPELPPAAVKVPSGGLP